MDNFSYALGLSHATYLRKNKYYNENDFLYGISGVLKSLVPQKDIDKILRQVGLYSNVSQEQFKKALTSYEIFTVGLFLGLHIKNKFGTEVNIQDYLQAIRDVRCGFPRKLTNWEAWNVLKNRYSGIKQEGNSSNQGSKRISSVQTHSSQPRVQKSNPIKLVDKIDTSEGKRYLYLARPSEIVFNTERKLVKSNEYANTYECMAKDKHGRIVIYYYYRSTDEKVREHVIMYVEEIKGKSIARLRDIARHFTKESIDAATKSTPYLNYYFSQICVKEPDIWMFDEKTYGEYSFYFWGIKDMEKKALEAVYLLDKVILELKENGIETNKLVRKQNNNDQLPPWVKTVAKTGLKIGLKAILLGLGLSVFDFDFDFDLGDGDAPDVNFGDADTPYIDFGDGDVTTFDFGGNDGFTSSPNYIDGSTGYSGDLPTGYQLAFKSTLPPNHLADGYIFQGGQTFNGFQIYTKGGHTFYWDSIKNIFVKIK